MSDQIKTPGAAAEAPAPKLKRGVSNQTQAVSQLRFHEKDAASNGLFIGHLENVSVEWSTNADAKTFTGQRVPRLVFHFASNHANVNERRHVYQNLFPVESNGEDWITFQKEVMKFFGRVSYGILSTLQIALIPKFVSEPFFLYSSIRSVINASVLFSSSIVVESSRCPSRISLRIFMRSL